MTGAVTRNDISTSSSIEVNGSLAHEIRAQDLRGHTNEHLSHGLHHEPHVNGQRHVVLRQGLALRLVELPLVVLLQRPSRHGDWTNSMTSNDLNLAVEQLGLGHTELDAELQGQGLLHILSGRRNPLQGCEFQRVLTVTPLAEHHFVVLGVILHAAQRAIA